jgi:hypothetical protein
MTARTLLDFENVILDLSRRIESLSRMDLPPLNSGGVSTFLYGNSQT